MKKKILGILFVGIIAIGLTGCNTDSNVNNEANNNYNNSSATDSSSNSSTTENDKYGLGDTLIFDGLELTFDSNYSFATVENRYSEYNGKSVIRLGVNVKNVSTKKNSLNMFYYDLFGSQGTQLNSITSYFDDAIDYAGELKPEASYKSYFYILYDGDGNYSIDFDNYSQEASVEFNVIK